LDSCEGDQADVAGFVGFLEEEGPLGGVVEQVAFCSLVAVAFQSALEDAESKLGRGDGGEAEDSIFWTLENSIAVAVPSVRRGIRMCSIIRSFMI